MKSSELLKKNNLNNLILMSKILTKFEHFIFYGTLLGMVRDKGIIHKDDDIDILVNKKHKKKTLEVIKKYKKLKINQKKSNSYFVQIINKIGNEKTFIDLYFYINKESNNFIEEKHNFLSSVNLPSHSIHIPKKMIFPIKNNKKYFNVKMPKKSKELCEFLYGKNWVKPMRKNSEYRMEIINHKPKLIERSLVGGFTRKIRLMISDQFKKT